MSQRPQITRAEAEQICRVNKVSDKAVIIGIRGYFLDSIGKKGANDRNVYDDAIIVISARGFRAFRANTDPSIYKKGVATMKTGVHRYYKGKHKGLYWALRLVGEQVLVTRDGETGNKIGIALNIHKGGFRTTGSLGCQTLHPNDWDEFIELVYDVMDFYDQRTIAYVLIDENNRRAGKFKMPSVTPILNDTEIDDLLNDLKPAAQVGKPQTPVSNPAAHLPTLQTNSQSSSEGESSKQPVQTIAEETAEGLPLPSLGGYIGKIGAAQEAVAQAQETIGAASGAIDQIKILKDALGASKDSKKSLWSTIGQIVYQSVWAIIAFFIGLPLEVWIVVAIVAAIVGVMYLYRQNSLGKIRETARMKILDLADFLK